MLDHRRCHPCPRHRATRSRCAGQAPPSPARPPPTLVCPNCDISGAKVFKLAASARFAATIIETQLFGCTGCGAAFFHPLQEVDYGHESVVAPAVQAFYVQQNAGISQIVLTLARLVRPPGTRYLDVGCGFGFGLDFAINACAWQGRGIDPSPLARAGSTLLGLPIAPRLLTPADAATPADIIMAS